MSRYRFQLVEQAAKVLYASTQPDFVPGFTDLDWLWFSTPDKVQSVWYSRACALGDAGLLAGVEGRSPWKDSQ